MFLKLSELIRFGLSGFIGFCVDGGLMQTIVISSDVSPLLARGISFPLAMSATWWLNRNWTFETGRCRKRSSQYVRYIAVQLVGFVVNYSCFAWLVMRTWLAAQPLLALAIASLLAMLVTYLSSRVFVFGDVRSSR